jgi:predicted phage terminase large subunit-like protein
LEYPDLRRAIVSQAQKWNPQAILIEDAASGMSVLQDLQGENLTLIPVKPEKSKEVRLVAVSALIEGGRVVIPEAASWLMDFEAEISTFPAAAHDDQVDALSQALGYFREHPFDFSPQLVGTGVLRAGASLPWR